MLNRWDNINRQVWRLGVKEKKPIKTISSLFWIIAFAAAAEEGIRRGSRKVINLLTGDEQKEESYLKDTALNVLQSVPLLGQLTSALTYSSNPVPVINAFEDVLEGIGSAVKGKAMETKLRGAVKASGGVGSLLGVPGSSQAAQIARKAIPEAKGGRSSGRSHLTLGRRSGLKRRSKGLGIK
jgi:hypothetical protein